MLLHLIILPTYNETMSTIVEYSPEISAKMENDKKHDNSKIIIAVEFKVS